MTQLPVFQAVVEQAPVKPVATFPQATDQQSATQASVEYVAVGPVATQLGPVQPVASVTIEDEVFAEDIAMMPMPLLTADFPLYQSVESESANPDQSESPAAAGESLVLSGASELRDNAFAYDSFASVEVTDSEIDDLVDAKQTTVAGA